MTNKTIVFGSVVTPTVAIALGIITWPGAKRHASIAQVPRPSVSTAAEMSELPNPQLSRVRLLVSNLN
jgi:hypothetical protein